MEHDNYHNLLGVYVWAYLSKSEDRRQGSPYVQTSMCGNLNMVQSAIHGEYKPVLFP